jgi:hypothetical protein
MLRAFILYPTLLTAACASAQTVDSVRWSNNEVPQLLLGAYDPATYAATVPLADPAAIICALRTEVSADSLQAHLERLVSFGTRHTYSDTLSSTTGTGAARRWAMERFNGWSAQHEGRLRTAWLRFNYDDPDCGPQQDLRNVVAVLPGSQVADPAIILIEAHLDSRCADNCDPLCVAQGAEDNGSGSALVMELARVLSRYTFRHTLVFMLTTGEEQGLLGAEALAQWCAENGVAIKGVQNNDIVGGIWCGATSSDPGCPVEGTADSTRVRLFSNGSVTKPYRGFARTIRMFYEEKLRPHAPVPMTIEVMGQEDREDRGGDHIPFREREYRNVRFTAAHEHGDANVEDSTYHDRQHTSDDVLGVDLDGDQVIDSFFVDFNYLQRNAVINGVTATLLAHGPQPPEVVVHDEPGGIRVSFTPRPGLAAWRVGVRQGQTSVLFSAVYRTTDTSFVVPGLAAGTQYFISAAAIDTAGIMSAFTREYGVTSDATTPEAPQDPLDLGIACDPIAVPERPMPPTTPLALWPNPCAAGCTVRLEAPGTLADGPVTWTVREGTGRLVERMQQPWVPAGGFQWNAPHRPGPYLITLDVRGRTMATGILVVSP